MTDRMMDLAAHKVREKGKGARVRREEEERKGSSRALLGLGSRMGGGLVQVCGMGLRGP